MTKHGKSHAMGTEARASNVSVRRVAKTTLSRQTSQCLVLGVGDADKRPRRHRPSPKNRSYQIGVRIRISPAVTDI